MLALAQVADEHDLSVGELQSIVMHARLVFVDLPKLSHPFQKLPNAEDGPAVLVLDFGLERDLRAGKQAHRHIRFADCGKSAGYGITESRQPSPVAT